VSAGARESPHLLALHEAHIAAWNARDFDRLSTLYHSDCLICDTVPPPAHRGWNEFRRRAEPALSSFSEFRIQTFARVSRAFERSDDRIGWVVSRYEIHGRRDDRDYSATGRWTEIYEKRGGVWKLIHLHSSIDPEDD